MPDRYLFLSGGHRFLSEVRNPLSSSGAAGSFQRWKGPLFTGGGYRGTRGGRQRAGGVGTGGSAPRTRETGATGGAAGVKGENIMSEFTKQLQAMRRKADRIGGVVGSLVEQAG